MIIETLRKAAWRRFLAHNSCPRDELDQFPALRPDRQREELSRRLLAQVRYFAGRPDALPEWREAAKARTPQDLWRIWPDLPVVDKNMLQTRFQIEVMERAGVKGRRRSTGGSTGNPTHFLHDEAMTRAGNATMIYAQIRMGWRPGDPLVLLWGSERDIGKRSSTYERLSDRILGTFVVDGYRLGPEMADKVLRVVNACRPVCMWGFTSMLEYLAREVLRRGLPVPPGSVRLVWNGGEMLFESQSQLFKQAFGVPILNMYGGRELSAMAFQEREGGPLRVLRPWLFVEVVDRNGRPAKPGEPGRLLWTSTICRGTPFLRYEIADMGTYQREHETEAGISALCELNGRVAGVLTLANGTTISCLYWNHLFKDVPGIQQFQVVIRAEGSLRLLLKGNPFGAEAEAKLASTIKQFIGDVPIEIAWVERIPLTAQGKLIQVVRESDTSAPAHPTQAR